MISKKVEAKLSDGDIRGAIRLLCSDDTVAPYNQSTIDSLLDKHPPHPEPLNFPVMPDVDEHPAEATEEEILATISSFRRFRRTSSSNFKRPRGDIYG